MSKGNALLLIALSFALLHTNNYYGYAFPLVCCFTSPIKAVSNMPVPVASKHSSALDEMKIVGKGSYMELSGTTVSFDIDASQRMKESAKGNLNFKSSYLEFKGNVDCLNLIDGKMIVSGTMRHISKGSLDWVFVGIRYQFTFEDSGTISPDRMSGISIGGPSDCVTAINLATPNEIKGSIQIMHYHLL